MFVSQTLESSGPLSVVVVLLKLLDGQRGCLSLFPRAGEVFLFWNSALLSALHRQRTGFFEPGLEVVSLDVFVRCVSQHGSLRVVRICASFDPVVAGASSGAPGVVCDHFWSSFCAAL